MLSRASATECRGYVKERGKVGGARADLGTLRVAISHDAKERACSSHASAEGAASGQVAYAL